jgi:hypothetical protein
LGDRAPAKRQRDRTSTPVDIAVPERRCPFAGPSVDNTCGAFALEMQPAILSGQTQLSAQQSASLPPPRSNVAAMSDFFADYDVLVLNEAGWDH